MITVVVVCAALLTGAAPTPALAQGNAAAPAAAVERIADIQIHGNNATPDADVLAIAAVKRGDAFTSTTLAAVAGRLKTSGRFEDVELRKRFASLSDPTQIALVIIVDEHPVSVRPAAEDEIGEPRIVRRRVFGRAMFMPILEGEDGYGLTYGLTTAFPDVLGARSRLSFPLSWGGRKRVAAEIDQPFEAAPISRALGGVSVERRNNPGFQEEDDRRRVWGRVERAVARVIVGSGVAHEQVSFGNVLERWTSIGADVTVDTRLDPALPRNAIYANASWTHLVGDTSGPIDRSHVDLRGYVGLARQVVLVTRVEYGAADRTLPPYFKSLLGGWSSLRGYRAGAFVGDMRLNGTLEIRMPVSSPLSVIKTGFSVFVDAGKAWDTGVTFEDVPYASGVGAGAWFAATIVRGGVAVARGRHGDTRVNLGVGMTF